VTSLKHFRTLPLNKLLDPGMKCELGPPNRKQDYYKSNLNAGSGEVKPFNMGMECFPTALHMCLILFEPRLTHSLRACVNVYTPALQFPYEIKFSPENHCLLGCDAVQFGRISTFWRKVLPPSSGSRNERNKKQLQFYFSLAS
jgi:hypothetical protein